MALLGLTGLPDGLGERSQVECCLDIGRCSRRVTIHMSPFSCVLYSVGIRRREEIAERALCDFAISMSSVVLFQADR